MPVMMRATFFFKDTNGYGWTETVHSKQIDYTSTLNAAKVLARARGQCCGTTARLVYIRVSDDLIKRDSLVFKIADDDGSTRTASAAASDIANTCLTTRLDGTPTGRRTLYMRGVPDSIVINSGHYSPSAAFQDAFDTWTNTLIADQWAIRIKDPLVTPVPITSIVQAPGSSLVVITTAANHGITVPGSCTIRGVTGPTWINGNWAVQAVPDGTHFSIVVGQLLTAIGLFGTASRIAYTLVNITQGEVVKVGHRVSGRPFDSPRGRRKARARR